MAKIKPISIKGERVGWMFRCPGCDDYHLYYTERRDHARTLWDFNGNIEKPTFKPSLVTTYSTETKRCHLFVTDGKIQYLGDCTHVLAGKTIPMEDIEP